MSQMKCVEELIKSISEVWTYKPICQQHNYCTHRSTFVNVAKLRTWMRSKHRSQSRTNFELALEETVNATPDFWTPEPLLEGEGCCMLVFSVLIAGGHGDLIPFFQRAGITDRNLAEETYNTDALRKILIEAGHQDKSISRVIDTFEEERWRFCPASLDSIAQMPQNYHSKIRMPFCYVEKVNDGGTASVFQVLVPQEFVSERIATTLGDPIQHEKYGKCYELAIKSYSEAQEDTFESELKAFRGLQGQEGIVRYFGCYRHQHGEHSAALTHHIILELGRMDLVGYFYRYHPPELPSEIIRFYERLFEISKSIETIHHLRHDQDTYLGWHGDVKPDNVLLVQDKWKLADFGYSKFERKSDATKVPRTYLKGGTNTYASPEVAGGRKYIDGAAITQDADTWSFGCVLSVAVTWVVLGVKGVIEYGVLRARTSQDRNNDYFHDGENVLPEIHKWHHRLKALMRRSDLISEALLDLIENSMIVTKDSGRRLASKDLSRELGKIIESAQVKAGKRPAMSLDTNDPTQPYNTNIVDALSCIENARRQGRTETARGAFGQNNALYDLLVSNRVHSNRESTINESQRVSLLNTCCREEIIAESRVDRDRHLASDPGDNLSLRFGSGQVEEIKAISEREDEESGLICEFESSQEARVHGGFDVFKLIPPTTVDLIEVQPTPSQQPIVAIERSNNSIESHLINNHQQAQPEAINGHSNSSQAIVIPNQLESSTRPSTGGRGIPIEHRRFWKLLNSRSSILTQYEEILDGHPEVAREVDEQGCTPVMLAVRQRNIELVKLLLPKSDVRQQDEGKMTILHHIVFEISKLSKISDLSLSHMSPSQKISPEDLLPLIDDVVEQRRSSNGEHEIDIVDIPNGLRETPLYFCVMHGLRSAAKSLLKYGALIHIPESRKCKDVLVAVLQKGWIEMVDLLLTNGARIEEVPAVLWGSFDGEIRRKYQPLRKSSGSKGLDWFKKHRRK